MAVGLVVSFAALAAVQPAAARWGEAIGLSGSAHSAFSAGNVLKKSLGRALGLADEMMGAVIDGDDEKVRKLSERLDEFPGHLARDASLPLTVVSRVGEMVGNAGERLEGMVASVKRRAERFVGRAGEAAVDARVALTRSRGDADGVSARRIFGPDPLPKVNVSPDGRNRRASDAPSPWYPESPASAKALSGARGTSAERRPTEPASASEWDARPVREPRLITECSTPTPWGGKEGCKSRFRARAQALEARRQNYLDELDALERREEARLEAERREEARLEAERREEARLEAERKARIKEERRREDERTAARNLEFDRIEAEQRRQQWQVITESIRNATDALTGAVANPDGGGKYTPCVEDAAGNWYNPASGASCGQR